MPNDKLIPAPPTLPLPAPARAKGAQRVLKVAVIQARAALIKNFASREGRRSLLTYVEARDARLCAECGCRFQALTGEKGAGPDGEIICPKCGTGNVAPEHKIEARMAAAGSILDRAFGRPSQEVQHTGKDGESLFTILELPPNNRLSQPVAVPMLMSAPVQEDDDAAPAEGELVNDEESQPVSRGRVVKMKSRQPRKSQPSRNTSGLRRGNT